MISGLVVIVVVVIAIAFCIEIAMGKGKGIVTFVIVLCCFRYHCYWLNDFVGTDCGAREAASGR